MSEDSRPEIIVHCPPGKSVVRHDNGSSICVTCKKKLIDLDAGDGGQVSSTSKDSFICGFRSAATSSVVAASLALSACDDKTEADLVVGSIEAPIDSGKLVSEFDGGDYPVAKRVPDNTGLVISPYSGRLVDVSGIPPGSMVTDPRYSIEDGMYFRLPENIEPPEEDSLQLTKGEAGDGQLPARNETNAE